MNNEKKLLATICEKKSGQKEKVPFYVFDTDHLCERIADIKKRLTEQITLCYAIKANPFLVKSMDEQMEKYEVCSPGELDICIRAGIDMKKVVFSGVNKQPEDVVRAVDAGVGVVTVESLRHFQMVKDYSEKVQASVKILPRLSSGAQFGMDTGEIEKIIAERAQYPQLTVIGIQYFTGTQKKLKKTLEELEYIRDYVKGLEETYALEMEVIEYGPGLKVPYFQGEDFAEPYAELEEVVRFVREQGGKYHYIFELGRYIAAGCGYYAASIVDKKETQGKIFALIDGGINHVNYYGQNMAMRIPMLTHYQQKSNCFYDAAGYHTECMEDETKAQQSEAVCICGSLCTFADVLIRRIFLKTLELDDVLVFHNIGAYSVTEGLYLFLSRSMPEIYIYNEKDGLQLVRERFETSTINGY